MKFDEVNFASEILAGIAAAGFEECTEVQARAMPHVISGSDVMVQSQTGTGKTAAFLLPTFQLLLHDERYKGARVLVVAPTRELAVQIKEESDVLSEGLSIRTEVFHGGVGYGPQQQALADGVEILVGTPGRILDLSQTGHLPLQDVRIAIIDEADRLFDMGFYPDIRRMMRRMVPREERTTMLFSATLSVKARNIAWEYMNDPVEIEIEPEQITVDRVNQTLYHVASEEKMSVLLGLLKRENPRTAIVFTNTKRQAEIVSRRLEINGYPSEFIVGDLPQRKRIAIIRKAKAGEAEFLVATDVAARGLHIDNLEMVVNFDLPEDPEAYVHRIGRTARAGETGKAITLACERYVFGLDSIEKLINQKIPVGSLTDDLHAEDKSANVYIRLETTGRDNDRDRDRDRDRGRGGRAGGRSGGRGGDRGRSEDTRRERRPERSERRPEKRTDRRPDRRPEKRGERRTQEAVAAPKASDTLEERLAYYRSKYGEDFQPTDEMLASMEGSRRDEGGSSPRRRRSRGGRNRKRGGAPSGARTEAATDGGRASNGEENKQNKQNKQKQPARAASKRGPAQQAPAEPKKSSPAPSREQTDEKSKGIFGRIKGLFGGK